MGLFLSLINFYFSPHKKYYLNLKNILGFAPRNIALYKSAFRHRSAAQPIQKGFKNSNERLEFLGDAILDAVIADYLFKKFPYKDEGFLTEMRSKIVNRDKIGELAVKLGIDVLIEYESLQKSDTNFKSLHGDALEALIGAIYLDKGYKFISKFLLKKIIIPFINLDDLETAELNYKSKLLEWSQKEGKDISFRVAEEIGTGDNKKYKIQVFVDGIGAETGIDFTKKKAEQIAAEKTYLILVKN